MGIVLGIIDVIADVAVEATAVGVAASAADAVVEEVGQTIAEAVSEGIGQAVGEGIGQAIGEGIGQAIGEDIEQAVGESIAEGTAEATAESTTEAIADGVGEEAGSNALDSSVNEAANQVVSSGASQAVRSVTKAVLTSVVVEEITRNTIKLIEMKESGNDIKKELGYIRDAMRHAKENLRTWNTQVNQALRKGRLESSVSVSEGTNMSVGTLFSTEINSAVTNFLKSVQGSYATLSALTKQSDPSIDALKNATRRVQAAFLEAAPAYLAAVTSWDTEDSDIRNKAHLDFHVAQAQNDIKLVRENRV